MASNEVSKGANGADARKYIAWDAPEVEKIPPSESEDIQAVAEQVNLIQRAQWNHHRHCYSGMSEARRIWPAIGWSMMSMC